MTRINNFVSWSFGLVLFLAIAGCEGTTDNSHEITHSGKNFTFKSVQLATTEDIVGAELTVPTGSKVMKVTAEGTAGLDLEERNIFLIDSIGTEVQVSAEGSEMILGGSKIHTIKFLFIMPENATGPYKIRFGDEPPVDLSEL